MAVTDLQTLLRQYLDACAAAVATTPAGPIDRVFVSPGIPAWDCCEQLTVHAGGTAEAMTAPTSPPLAEGHRANVQGSLTLVTMTATVLREEPTIGQNAEVPSATSLEAAAAAVNDDLWAIWNWLHARKRDGTLFPPVTRELFFDGAVSVNPSGGIVGWQIPVRVQLGGYAP